MHMYNPVASRCDDIVCIGSGMVPVPRIEQQSHICSAFLSKLERVIHTPDELVRLCFAEM